MFIRMQPEIHLLLLHQKHAHLQNVEFLLVNHMHCGYVRFPSTLWQMILFIKH